MDVMLRTASVTYCRHLNHFVAFKSSFLFNRVTIVISFYYYYYYYSFVMDGCS